MKSQKAKKHTFFSGIEWIVDKQVDPIKTYVGNGLCDPQMNTPECHYDGGDCCLEIVDTDKCYVGGNCACHFTGKVHTSWRKGKTSFLGLVMQLMLCGCSAVIFAL